MWRDKWSSVQNMLVRRRKTGDVSWKALCHVQPHDVWWVRPLDTCTIHHDTQGCLQTQAPSVGHMPWTDTHTHTHRRTHRIAHTAEIRSLGFAAGPKFQTSTMLEAWTVDASISWQNIFGVWEDIAIGAYWRIPRIMDRLRCLLSISFSPSATSRFVYVPLSGSGNKSRVFWTAKLSTANLSYRCSFVCEAEPLLFDGTLFSEVW